MALKHCQHEGLSEASKNSSTPKSGYSKLPSIYRDQPYINLAPIFIIFTY